MVTIKNKNIDWLYHFVNLLVVFLGITAGFILQNRKETKINNELENKYITGILADIAISIEDLNEAILDDSIWLQQNKYALSEMMNGTLVPDSANQLMVNMAHFSKFSAQTDTYENMKNSGNLNLINNFEHKQAIVKYYKSLEDFELLEQYFKDFNTQNFMPYMLEHFNLFDKKFTDKGEASMTRFKNIFGSYYSLKQQRLEGYRRLLNESEEVKEIISGSINANN